MKYHGEPEKLKCCIKKGKRGKLCRAAVTNCYLEPLDGRHIWYGSCAEHGQALVALLTQADGERQLSALLEQVT